MSDLVLLEERLREDIDRLNFFGKAWVPARAAGVRDVVVIGAGMCGLVASLALKRHGIVNHVVYDMAPEGAEGPWVTIARMETLRSPKQLTGPAFGLPSLTFRAWFEAARGVQAWTDLFRITRQDWMEYLVWYRKVMQLPIINDARMTGLEDAGNGLIALQMTIAGKSERVLTRKLVLATGRDGLGGNYVPDIIRGIDKRFWAHSAEEIDFARLKGRNVIVVGAGASAMDNAATALESGAARVDLLIRRAVMPTVNKGMGIGSPGMTHGYQALSDDWKWKIQDYLNRSQTPAPKNSTLRVSRHDNAYFHFGSPMEEIREEDGALTVRTPKATYRADFMIFATGFTVDFSLRPELATIAPHVRLWQDAMAADDPRRRNALATSPVLGDHFELTEKVPGAFPALGNVYNFNFTSTLTHGKLSGDIPAISEGADRLVRGIIRNLFVEDAEHHFDTLVAYDTPELDGDEWRDADLVVEKV